VVSGTVEVVVTGNIFVLLSTPACSYMKTHGNETQRYVLDVALEGASFGEELALNPETPSALDYCASESVNLQLVWSGLTCMLRNEDFIL